METTSIEERMRELTNQVILPPRRRGGASVNRRSLTQSTCRWTAGTADTTGICATTTSSSWTPQKRLHATCLERHRPLRPNDPEIMSVRVNVSHVWLCIKEVSGRTQERRGRRSTRLLQARRQGVSRPPRTGGASKYEPVMQDSKTFDPRSRRCRPDRQPASAGRLPSWTAPVTSSC
jgi:hypothetical protein